MDAGNRRKSQEIAGNRRNVIARPIRSWRVIFARQPGYFPETLEEHNMLRMTFPIFPWSPQKIKAASCTGLSNTNPSFLKFTLSTLPQSKSFSVRDGKKAAYLSSGERSSGPR